MIELKVNEIAIPDVISFNYDEIKMELAETLQKYESMVYSADQMKAAKADKAALNKLRKALNDERIRREREYMAPFMDFKAKIAELISLVDKPVIAIDTQVKAYEEQKKLEKRKQIEEYFESECDFPEWLKLDQIFKPQWLNATFSMKSIQEELVQILGQIESDLAVLSEMPAFAFEATEVYKQTLNLQTAVNEGKRLADIQKRKEEAARAAELGKAVAKSVSDSINESVKNAIEETIEEVTAVGDGIQDGGNLPPVAKAGQWIAFQAFLTVAQAKELRAFFEQRGIKFKSI